MTGNRKRSIGALLVLTSPLLWLGAYAAFFGVNEHDPEPLKVLVSLTVWFVYGLLITGIVLWMVGYVQTRKR
jgi:RsiW-degrading membrane proteinase PrsW (M82 family)